MSAVILGGRGMGKSVLLRQIREAAAQLADTRICLFPGPPASRSSWREEAVSPFGRHTRIASTGDIDTHLSSDPADAHHLEIHARMVGDALRARK